MEWRCEWCGKPHAEDDPPCDNCGHGTFEKAVVQAPAEGQVGDSTTVWVCTECGREHPKHTPPCSRCGNPDLERREITVDEDELMVPGYRDLLTPQYVAGIVLALALAVVLVLGLAGVINLPGLGTAVPDVAGVPGNATHLDDISLTDVEAAYLARMNELRSSSGLSQLDRTDRLQDVATHYNQRRVKAELASGQLPTDEQLFEWIGDRCGDGAVLVPYDVEVPPSVTSAGAIGERLAARAFENQQANFQARQGITGLDMHTYPNGTLSITQFAC
jgi:hypothetical protein